MRMWYDGYYVKSGERLYNPWSVLLSYNHETELTAVVNLVYLAARDRYRVERVDKAGIGYVDLHDFNCADANDMKIGLPAQRTKYLKESPEGVSEMCREMEIMRNKSREEGREEGKLEQARESAINFARMDMPVEKIAQGLNVSIELVKQWITPAAVK